MALRPLLRRTTPLDWIVVGGLLALVAATFLITSPREKGRRVVVERAGKIVYTAPLSTDGTATIEGDLGMTVLTIRNATVCVESSPCPLKVCMGMRRIESSGEILACVPNGILVRIEGEKGSEETHDLITR